MAAALAIGSEVEFCLSLPLPGRRPGLQPWGLQILRASTINQDKCFEKVSLQRDYGVRPGAVRGRGSTSGPQMLFATR